MGGLFFDILEINIVAGVAIILLCIFADRLRGRYGAGWMKLAWLLLAVRLMIPYHLSLPGMEIRLLNYAGFEQKDFTRGEEVQAYSDGAEAGEEIEVHGDGMEAGEEAQTYRNVVVSGTEAETHGDNMAAEQEAEAYMDGVMAVPEVQAHMAGMTAGQEAEMHSDGLTSGNVKAKQETAAFFYTRLLMTGWLTGACIIAACFVGSYLVFIRRNQKSLRLVTDTRFIRQICMLQKKTTGHARLMTYQSVAVTSPCLMGLLRPKLVLPADISKWKKTELELIMAHEMCHYRKKDLWLKMLMSAVCCINWFNPLIWVMKKQFFYDMELACDGSVLADSDDDERERYARVMLAFAGGRKMSSAFSTGFGGNRKQMKTRIDYMLDTGAKKKGRLSLVIAMMLVLTMGMAVSCGYKQESGGTEASGGMMAGNDRTNENTASGDGTNPDTDGGRTADGGVTDSDASDGKTPDSGAEEGLSGENGEVFDENHAYNDVVKGYQGDVYLTREDGIYYLKGGQGEEKLLYANAYEERPRGMEIDGKNLYFSGSAPADSGGGATVYRLDLDTHEVTNALAAFALKYSDYRNVSVYEGKLYVAVGATSTRIGFALDEKGDAVSQLDDESPDYLYKEYNDYMNAELERTNTEYDSDEYWTLTEAQHDRYQAVTDVASCKKLLDGRQVVSQYKDESLISIYLENEDGTYEYLCDTTGFPMLVTESGIYYEDISMEIWYVDYETKQREVFYRLRDRDNREWSEVRMVTYDAGYVYLIQHKHIGDYYHNDGESVDKGTVEEYYLVRVSREDGESQKVYRFADNVSMYGENGWYRHCGVYNGRMYFDNRESFSLDPDENDMQALNSGVPCEDAVAIKETIRTFAKAYFTNDGETLRGLLTDDFEKDVSLYNYPEQADRIKETYVGGEGIPSTNLDIGVSVYVYYEFTGWAETEENTVAYLTMRMTKTQDGFKVQWYDLQL